MNKKADEIIDLRKADFDEPEFVIEKIGDTHDVASEKLVERMPVKSVAPNEELVAKASDKVKIKFDKFVNLISTHAFEDVIDEHQNEDVIISTDLLTDLANAHEEKEDNKMPIIFVVGIALGIFITWLILRT